MFGFEVGNLKNLKISLARAKLEIFAFLIEGMSIHKIKRILIFLYEGFHKSLSEEDRGIYFKTLESSTNLISKLLSRVSAEEVIGLLSKSNLDDWGKEYERFISKLN